MAHACSQVRDSRKHVRNHGKESTLHPFLTSSFSFIQQIEQIFCQSIGKTVIFIHKGLDGDPEPQNLHLDTECYTLWQISAWRNIVNNPEFFHFLYVLCDKNIHYMTLLERHCEYTNHVLQHLHVQRIGKCCNSSFSFCLSCLLP